MVLEEEIDQERELKKIKMFLIKKIAIIALSPIIAIFFYSIVDNARFICRFH